MEKMPLGMGGTAGCATETTECQQDRGESAKHVRMMAIRTKPRHKNLRFIEFVMGEGFVLN